VKVCDTFSLVRYAQVIASEFTNTRPKNIAREIVKTIIQIINNLAFVSSFIQYHPNRPEVAMKKPPKRPVRPAKMTNIID
jgi:hypothetical protein